MGIVDYLNSRPLARGFLTGYRPDLFAPSCHPPARVAELLAQGELDVGLIPSIEVLRIGGLAVLPDACVGATHEVRSVLLLAGRPLAQVRRVALDVNSRTSAALVRILFVERFGACPEYVGSEPVPEAMLADCDAALVIGDPALAVDRSRLRVYDLAAEWRALTGLPFVFAVWAVRPPAAALPDLAAHFRRSLAIGRAELGAIVADAVATLGLSAAQVRSYLTHALRYELGGEERAGLAEFYRRAHCHGLVDRPGPIPFLAAEELPCAGAGGG